MPCCLHSCHCQHHCHHVWSLHNIHVHVIVVCEWLLTTPCVLGGFLAALHFKLFCCDHMSSIFQAWACCLLESKSAWCCYERRWTHHFWPMPSSFESREGRRGQFEHFSLSSWTLIKITWLVNRTVQLNSYWLLYPQHTGSWCPPEEAFPYTPYFSANGTYMQFLWEAARAWGFFMLKTFVFAMSPIRAPFCRKQVSTS